jgi:hypothetical protein
MDEPETTFKTFQQFKTFKTIAECLMRQRNVGARFIAPSWFAWKKEAA